jgi:hypothetical protein
MRATGLAAGWLYKEVQYYMQSIQYRIKDREDAVLSPPEPREFPEFF